MPPTGTVTFLFTDIEGSTRLWEEQPESMTDALARHDRILRSAIEEQNGYVFTTAGDAFAAAFALPRDAAEASLQAQRALSSSDGLDELRVRMALHVGAAEERDGDYFGPTLNRCARILAAGHGGQILASLAIEQVAGDDLPEGVTLTDLGEHRLKDLSRPERIFQLDHPDQRTDFPSLLSLDALPNNLPVQLTTFVGRDQQLQELVHLVREHRLLTLTGVGGSGKTRLATQAAADVIDDFPDGAWMIELAPVADTQLVPQAVASGLGVSAGTVGAQARSTIEAVADFLAPRRLLLILDNCEHLLDAAARLTDRLLARAPGLHIVATSREGLGIGGERIWQTPSLDVGDEWDTDQEWSEQANWEAVRLFAERSMDVQPAFELTEATVPRVVDICRRLDGMPLAIELAAARTRMLSVDQINERLDDRFRLLTGGSRTALPRQQTLLATVEWSYDLLSDAETLLFDRLAAFRGGFTLEAAEAVCSGDGLEDAEVLDLLGQLLDRSLVHAEAAPLGPHRYHMLETVRQYAVERLADRGLGDALRHRHAEYFLRFAETAAPRLETPDMAAWLERLAADHDNFRAALRWMLEAGHAEDAIAMTVALSVWFWFIRRHHEEAFRWHTQTLAAAPDAPPSLLADALAAASMQAVRTEKFEEAKELANRGLALAQEVGNRRAETMTQWTIGDVARIQADRQTALVHYLESMKVAEASGDDIWICRLCRYLLIINRALGKKDEARKYGKRGLEIGERSGWPMGLAEALDDASELALEDRDLARAELLTMRFLEIEEELGDPRNIITARSKLSTIARLAGHNDVAAEHARKALVWARRHGDPMDQTLPSLELTAVELAQGNLEEATAWIVPALRTIRRFPYRWMAGRIIAAAAPILVERGDLLPAVRLFAASERLFRDVGLRAYEWEQAESEHYLLVARKGIDPEEFEEAWRSGLDLKKREAIDLALDRLNAS